MRLHPPASVVVGFALVVGLALTQIPLSGQEAAASLAASPASSRLGLAPEQAEEFLRSARVIRGRPIGRGITRPFRLTLSDGTLTQDAAFNTVNRRSTMERFADRTFEPNFVDAYRYNIAAYRLARLLELEDFVPPAVERRWNGRIGSLTWWIGDAIEEGERRRRGLRPPDPRAWNHQIYRVRVFNNLVYDTDRNAGNMLITSDWHCWLIDFTRAFRRWDRLPAESDLEQIDGKLLAALRRLDVDAIMTATNDFLEKREAEALIDRRDLIVARFDGLIAERGEAAVIY